MIRNYESRVRPNLIDCCSCCGALIVWKELQRKDVNDLKVLEEDEENELSIHERFFSRHEDCERDTTGGARSTASCGGLRTHVTLATHETASHTALQIFGPPHISHKAKKNT